MSVVQQRLESLESRVKHLEEELLNDPSLEAEEGCSDEEEEEAQDEPQLSADEAPAKTDQDEVSFSSSGSDFSTVSAEADEKAKPIKKRKFVVAEKDADDDSSVVVAKPERVVQKKKSTSSNRLVPTKKEVSLMKEKVTNFIDKNSSDFGCWVSCKLTQFANILDYDEGEFAQIVLGAYMNDLSFEHDLSIKRLCRCGRPATYHFECILTQTCLCVRCRVIMWCVTHLIEAATDCRQYKKICARKNTNPASRAAQREFAAFLDRKPTQLMVLATRLAEAATIADCNPNAVEAGMGFQARQ